MPLVVFASVRLRVFLLFLLRLPKSLPVPILLLFNLHDLATFGVSGGVFA